MSRNWQRGPGHGVWPAEAREDPNAVKCEEELTIQEFLGLSRNV